jgi:pheromone shutdown protein TraB
VQEQHQQVQAQLSTADKIAGEAQALKARMSDEMETAIAKAAETAARAKATDHKVEVTRDRFKQKMKALAEASEQAVEEAVSDHDEATKKVISAKQMESEMSQKLEDQSRL